MFTDRTDAGERLSKRLEAYKGTDALVIGLARGGVAVSAVVAHTLHLSQDVTVVKKISPPFQQELAIGAVAPDSVFFVDYKMTGRMGIDERHIQDQIAEKSNLVKQKMQLYRKGKPPFTATGKTVIIVDDGAATGATLTAAVKWIKRKNAKKIVVAIPVAPPEVANSLKPEVDELIVLETPSEFSAVGEFYETFPQIEDQEVVQLLNQKIV